LTNWLIDKLKMNILRFITAGNVDDGKSTLIGRLLYDSKSILADQLEALEQQSKNKNDDGIDLAILTDGLRAEREQGITIDVAYRYFATPKRKFIIADAPGHTQYTRNMITGASNSQLIIILVDARNGVTEQTRRHSIIASLLNMDQATAEQFTNDCRYEITHISRLKPAEMNQQLFDRVLGPNKVKDEAEFRDEIRKLMKAPLNQRSEVGFERDLRALLIRKVGDVPLADDILKRWLLLTSDKVNPEDLDRDYPILVEDMKYHVAREYFMAENGLKAEDSDIEEVAKLLARSHFMQYGILSASDDLVGPFVRDLLKDEAARRNLINRAADRKFAEWAKGQITVETVEVSPEEYEKTLASETANNNDAVKEEGK